MKKKMGDPRHVAVLDRLVNDISQRIGTLMSEESITKLLTPCEGFALTQIALAFVVCNVSAGAPDQEKWLDNFVDSLEWPELIEHRHIKRRDFFNSLRKSTIKGVPI